MPFVVQVERYLFTGLLTVRPSLLLFKFSLNQKDEIHGTNEWIIYKRVNEMNEW